MYDKLKSVSAPWWAASSKRWDELIAHMQDEVQHDQEAMMEFKRSHDGMTPLQYASWAFPCSE